MLSDMTAINHYYQKGHSKFSTLKFPKAIKNNYVLIGFYAASLCNYIKNKKPLTWQVNDYVKLYTLDHGCKNKVSFFLEDFWRLTGLKISHFTKIVGNLFPIIMQKIA